MKAVNWQELRATLWVYGRGLLLLTGLFVSGFLACIYGQRLYDGTEGRYALVIAATCAMSIRLFLLLARDLVRWLFDW
jgi:hypothetical protein